MGFEIEVTELDAFYNQRTRRLAQRLKAEAADAPQKKCVGLKRSVAGLYARVRAYNKFGFGEWSDESELMALEPLTPEEQVSSPALTPALVLPLLSSALSCFVLCSSLLSKTSARVPLRTRLDLTRLDLNRLDSSLT